MYEAQVQLEFVNKILNRNVALSLPLSIVLQRNLILFSCLAVVLAGVVRLRPLLINPSLWWAISLIGYCICTSGIVYCQANKVPIFRFDQDEYGQMYVSEYFMREMRRQYGGEGYIASALASVISLVFLLLAHADRMGKTPSEMRILVLFGIFGGFCLLHLFKHIYKLKTPWYENNFMPPAEYLRGPIMRDQGNNI